MNGVLPVLYIGGYGRSGSTLLDVLLDAQEAVLGAGEVTHLFRLAAEGRACSCGRVFLDCPVWATALHAVMNPNQKNLRAAETLTRAVETRRTVSHRHRARYADLWSRLLQAAADAAGAVAVVDSSKTTRGTTFRARRLGLSTELSLRVVQLWREPSQVAASALAARDRRAATGRRRIWDGDSSTLLRTLLGWITSNRAASRQADKVIKFDDLIHDSAAVTVATLALVRPVDGVVPTLVGGAGHGVAGNRMRRQGQPIQARAPKSVVQGRTGPGGLGSKIILSRIAMRTAVRLGGGARFVA